MTSAELTPDQLRRDPLPLRGRVALVTGVSRRVGIGYAIARRLAGLGASLVIHHYAPHDRDQPWGADPGGLEAVTGGVNEALADPASAAGPARSPTPRARVRSPRSPRPWPTSSATAASP